MKLYEFIQILEKIEQEGKREYEITSVGIKLGKYEIYTNDENKTINVG